MKNFITFSIVLFSGFVWAQDNLIYGELGGASPMLSVNYERQFFDNSHINIRAGVGVSFWETFDNANVTAPLGLYYLQDVKNGNFIELGVTTTLNLSSLSSSNYGFLLPNIGYRKYYANKKGFLKLTFCPVIFDKDEFLPWAGISVGQRF
ncbi:hypothetical protein [Flagellimonas lutimaris]|uniref:hypothetical protein n=1 Tax=Flagellimonas lutimaris TaxID=475082 RepID=UPI003F5CEEAE